MCDTRIRTTSALESYNNQLRMKIGPRSNFFKFVYLLIEQEGIRARDFKFLLRNGGDDLTDAQTARQDAIERGTVRLLSNRCSPEDFLASVAHASATKELCDDFNIAGECQMAYFNYEKIILSILSFYHCRCGYIGSS